MAYFFNAIFLLILFLLLQGNQCVILPNRGVDIHGNLCACVCDEISEAKRLFGIRFSRVHKIMQDCPRREENVNGALATKAIKHRKKIDCRPN